MNKTSRLSTILATIALTAPLSAAAVVVSGVANLWPGSTAAAPPPELPGASSQLRANLANFDDLDFRVYSTQQWQDVHLSHADDVIVHWPNGRDTQGLATHIEDMKWMFSFAPDTKIEEHPVRFGTNDAEWTAVTSWLEGTFTKPMVDWKGNVTPPTNKHFRIRMVTLGHWNSAGLMNEEFLFWDNQEFYSQLGLLPQSTQ